MKLKLSYTPSTSNVSVTARRKPIRTVQPAIRFTKSPRRKGLFS